MSEDPSITALRFRTEVPDYRVFLVGRKTSVEFDVVVDRLLSLAPEATYRLFVTLEELRVGLSEDPAPDLILFIQTWSDEFRFSQVITLPAIGPLTPMFCVTGPWCVSDGRSRQDWPLGLRISLDQLHREILPASSPDGTTRRSAGVFPTHWTAGRDEVFAAIYPVNRHTLRPHGNPIEPYGKSRPESPRIRLSTPDRALQELWTELFQRAAFTVSTGAFDAPPHDKSCDDAPCDDSPCDVVLWDADFIGSDFSNSDIAASWDVLRDGESESRLFVISGFLTPDAMSRWEFLGAAGCLSKLLPLSALVDHINQSWD